MQCHLYSKCLQFISGYIICSRFDNFGTRYDLCGKGPKSLHQGLSVNPKKRERSGGRRTPDYQLSTDLVSLSLIIMDVQNDHKWETFPLINPHGFSFHDCGKEDLGGVS